jgi:hypothetical protein
MRPMGSRETVLPRRNTGTPLSIADEILQGLVRQGGPGQRASFGLLCRRQHFHRHGHKRLYSCWQLAWGDYSLGSGPDLSGAFRSQGFNLIGQADGSAGFTNGSKSDLPGSVEAPMNPLLGPLQMNGGPTPTHALHPGSPAIDQGSSFGIYADDCPVAAGGRLLRPPKATSRPPQSVLIARG